jgi:hypothetical protein
MVSRVLASVVALAIVGSLAAVASAQILTNSTRSVGGVWIDPNGHLQNAMTDEVGSLGRLRLQSMEQIPAELNSAAPLRKVSLRRLEAAIAESRQTGKELPDAIKYLAGLQRVQYIFVYPEQQDIVLVGLAEGWKVDAKGNVVGVGTGRPVMLLDDLLVALRSANRAAQGGISCSIDPTPEGLARLQSAAGALRGMGDPQETLADIETALGQQKISVTGVPATSHFGRVLVAADYRMKRIAMAFEPAPIKGLPSFLQMLTTGRGMSSMLPRWWLEPRYEPLLRDGDGLAWEIRGSSVKAMTEEDFINAQGQKHQTGKANPVAQKWADTMTAKYAELAVAEPIFGQLQNCMDLAIVGALIAKERLNEKAGFSMPVLLDASSLKTSEFPAPTTCDSKASVLKKQNGWVISASGGVLINSWAIADKTEQADAPAKIRAKAAAGETSAWWWD